MKVPENPFRKAMANLYIERHMGKPEDEGIKKAVNGDNEEIKSIDYYIAAERFISRAIEALKQSETKECQGAAIAFTMMATYVSYEIERLIALEDNN